MSHSIEILRKVWDDKEGVCLTVSPNGEIPGFILLTTDDAKSKQWFGDVYLNIDKGIAKALGEALIATAAEAE